MEQKSGLDSRHTPRVLPRDPKERFKDWTFVSALGMAELDIQKISAAPIHEFRRYYLGQMKQYFDEDKKMGRDPRICFDGCRREIKGPRELRRYYGRDMCPKCFKAKIASEKNMTPRDSAYWGLVARV